MVWRRPDERSAVLRCTNGAGVALSMPWPQQRVLPQPVVWELRPDLRNLGIG